MYYNEAYEERQQEESALLTKWEKALGVDGGIKDEHMARTTAIVLENYLQYLHSDPRLIAEDRIQTNAFTGVNLALLGLIARVIPNLVGAELVGVQAMPTPRSPIFTIAWTKDDTKGASTDGDELWETPITETLGLDPHYSSQIVEETTTAALIDAGVLMVWGNRADAFTNPSGKPYLMTNSLYITVYDDAGEVLADYYLAGDLTSDISATHGISAAGVIDAANSAEDGGVDVTMAFTAATRTITASGEIDSGPGAAGTVGDIKVRYEYKAEAEAIIPEISFEITEQTVDLIRRQLRGKYTMDAAYDLKKLHGINLDSELANMMKVELQAEINREIVGDVRMLAGLTQAFDYANFSTTTGITTTGNYNDAHMVLLDAINICAAEIHVQGRLGMGNWVVGNPATLAFLDRVPGFVGSGVSYNGKEINFMGSLGGKMKFYSDPLYPKAELLIGYKGPGALDAGYLHCPYLPITATPTMINPETGDPSKIFYTRYGKTFDVESGQKTTNMILNGQYQYCRMSIAGLPASLTF